MKRLLFLLLLLHITGSSFAQGSSSAATDTTLQSNTIEQSNTSGKKDDTTVPATVDWDLAETKETPALVADDNTISFAVLALQPNGIEANVVSPITERLRNELISINDFSCVDKMEMQQILEESNIQSTGCFTNDCAVQTGQLLNVTYCIVGSIGKMGKIHSLHLRVIDIKAGKISFVINKDCQCPIETIYTTTIKEAAGEIANNILKNRYTGLHITTNPADATVFLNSKNAGQTPYQNEMLKPGVYSLELKLDTYKAIKQSLELPGGETKTLTYNLIHSQAYLDSLKAVAALKAEKKAREEAEKKAAAEKAKKRKKIKLISRIALGTCAAGLIACGYYMDMQLEDKQIEKQMLYNKYLSSENLAQLNQNKADYDKAHENGENLVTYRTLLYVAAGVSTAGIGVTFFF